MRISELYQSKEKRDARYEELKAQGVKCKRGTTGPQQIHPQYVTDFIGSEKDDVGVGNMVYKTYFKQLYKLEQL